MSDVPSFALTLTIGLAVVVSLVTNFRLFEKHIDGRPLLQYEPRRPVPWSFLAPLVMLAPLLLALWSALQEAPLGDPVTEAATLTSAVAAEAVGAPPAAVVGSYAIAGPVLNVTRRMADDDTLNARIWAQSAMTILLAVGCYVLLAVAFGATPRDLGLPRDWDECRRDVKVGATAWAASLVPIYAILLVLNVIFQPTEGHPLIEELIADHSWPMMAAAAFAAMVAAPLYEETAFRLAFQGWFERREMLAGRIESVADLTDHRTFDQSADAAPPTAPIVTYAYPSPSWIPVAISSVIFGLAHYGHGVSPAPLILLGVVLGYLYRQTHRILPCIVCHMLFNGFTFVMLALQFSAAD